MQPKEFFNDSLLGVVPGWVSNFDGENNQVQVAHDMIVRNSTRAACQYFWLAVLFFSAVVEFIVSSKIHNHFILADVVGKVAIATAFLAVLSCWVFGLWNGKVNSYHQYASRKGRFGHDYTQLKFLFMAHTPGAIMVPKSLASAKHLFAQILVSFLMGHLSQEKEIRSSERGLEEQEYQIDLLKKDPASFYGKFRDAVNLGKKFKLVKETQDWRIYFETAENEAEAAA
ncbi:hypothetical protein COB52_02865 [Candidatus Kaiserbacteria bacterium]|nr:MAG: hypothetical protein COB52_02865 [Candidatus Kaiserbacteria bacterium]